MYCMVTVLCVMVTTGAGCGLWWSVWPEPLSVGPCAAAAGPAWVIECLWTRDYHAYHDICSVMQLHRHISDFTLPLACFSTVSLLT